MKPNTLKMEEEIAGFVGIGLITTCALPRSPSMKPRASAVMFLRGASACSWHWRGQHTHAHGALLLGSSACGWLLILLSRIIFLFSAWDLTLAGPLALFLSRCWRRARVPGVRGSCQKDAGSWRARIGTWPAGFGLGSGAFGRARTRWSAGLCVKRLSCFCRYLRWSTERLQGADRSSAALMSLDARFTKFRSVFTSLSALAIARVHPERSNLRAQGRASAVPFPGSAHRSSRRDALCNNAHWSSMPIDSVYHCSEPITARSLLTMSSRARCRILCRHK